MAFHINRRTVLRAAGVSIVLPWLECMAPGEEPAATAGQADGGKPRRLACIFFPNGVALPEEEKYADLRWFPTGSGKEYRLTSTLAPLAPWRDEITIIGNIQHPATRKLFGHYSGDVWLTGADITSGYHNSVSVDQVAAAELGLQTRFESLVMSPEGGVGPRLRANTLSFNALGQPVQATADPSTIFARLFGAESTAEIAERRALLDNDRSVLDKTLQQVKSLQGRLGAADREQMEQFLSAIRELEKRIQRRESWLDVPKPKLEREPFDLVHDVTRPKEMVRTYYELLALAFQTDSTRVATYQICRENVGPFQQLPGGLGLPSDWHRISHNRSKGNFESPWYVWAALDRFCAEQFAWFLERLRSVREGDGTLLDQTMLLYGCATSTTHNSNNYPTIVAGGRGCGLTHGQYVQPPGDTPFANVLYTLLDRLELPSRPIGFADSTGRIEDLCV